MEGGREWRAAFPSQHGAQVILLPDNVPDPLQRRQPDFCHAPDNCACGGDESHLYTSFVGWVNPTRAQQTPPYQPPGDSPNADPTVAVGFLPRDLLGARPLPRRQEPNLRSPRRRAVDTSRTCPNDSASPLTIIPQWRIILLSIRNDKRRGSERVVIIETSVFSKQMTI